MLVQRARTLVPVAPMIAIAQTTIRPRIRAYSITSPPASSASTFRERERIVFIALPLTRREFKERSTSRARGKSIPLKQAFFCDVEGTADRRAFWIYDLSRTRLL